MKCYDLSLHIFRRDLRLEDNTAFLKALSESDRVIPCFIFDKRQIENNPYRSDNCVQFMIQCLADLDRQLKTRGGKLYVFYGISERIVEGLISEHSIQAVYCNRDYTPFSRRRDAGLQELCNKKNVEFHCVGDALLHEPEEIVKQNGEPYTVFTPFWKAARSRPVRVPHQNNFTNYYLGELSLETDTRIFSTVLAVRNSSLLLQGGRAEASTLLRKACSLKEYGIIRNYPARAGTSHLSAHHKFGTVSTREVYHAFLDNLGQHHDLLKELYWRDFFTHITYHFPHVFGGSFHQKYDFLVWDNDAALFRAWCSGNTGFPLIDAGMRELNTTGFMHNRVRMVTASFLVKDLHIDWRWGEKYFAQHLIDYDPSVNNGNWQWAASTGCDAQPYFRIFNPWLQQVKFDPDAVYIKKWIPALRDLSAAAIHKLSQSRPDTLNYPEPVVDHAAEAAKSKMMYALVARKSV